MPPAAVLRGFANVGSPRAARSALSRAKSLLRMYASPRTSTWRGIGTLPPRSASGIVLIVRRFAVTSSPTLPSPRVPPAVSCPSS